MLTTAEGSSDRFEPIFLQNVFFIGIPEPQKKIWQFFFRFYPLKEPLFLGGVPDFPDFQNWGSAGREPHFWQSAAQHL